MSAVTLPLRHRARRAAAAMLALTVLAGPLALAPLAAAQGNSTFGVPAQTKEEARKAREASSSGSVDTGGGISTQTGLIIGAVVVMAAAAAYIVIDSRDSVRAEGQRPVAAPTSGAGGGGALRGVPKTMFTGEGAPGGRTGKAKKREKTRRQKQARRRNR